MKPYSRHWSATSRNSRCREGDGAGIGGDAIAVAADDLVERQTGDLGGQVPEGDVDRAEGVQRQLLDPVDFPDSCQRCSFSSGSCPIKDVAEAAIEQIDDDPAAAQPRRRR